MAVNKVDVGSETVLDLSQDSVTPETLLSGVTAHDAAGERIVGVAPGIPATTALLKGDGTGGVSAATVGTDYALTRSYTVTLAANGWTLGSNSLYTQSVAITGLTASTPVVIVDVVLPTNDTDSRDLILAAWMVGPGANGAAQGTGTLTFYADSAPEVNIPIVVGVGE